MSFGWKFEVIQKTLNEADNQLSVSMLCEIAGVSRSGYYRWVKAVDVRDKRDKREKKDREDFELILKAYNQRGYRCTRHTYVHAPLEPTDCDECKEDKEADG